MNTENFVIVTSQPEFAHAAVGELQQLDKRLVVIEEIITGITLCSTPDVARLMRNATAAFPIFARHLAPVQEVIAIENNEQDLGTIAIAIASLPTFTLLERGTHFAVQSRLIQTSESQNERPYSSGKLNQVLAAAFAEETGAVESIKKPQVVISLLCTTSKGYLGISTAEENLSNWPGGARQFAHTSEQISRAEFKLLEALDVFGVTFPSQGCALDLGAAPGGWTRLLLDAGMSVVGVDPAHLDSRLGKSQRLEQYQGYAQQYIEMAIRSRRYFEIIVNDMRMDAREAARLLSKAAQCLRTDGFVISTLKLPHTTRVINPLATLKEAMSILQKRYKLVHARQLFHNRQEVTIVAAHPLPMRRE